MKSVFWRDLKEAISTSFQSQVAVFSDVKSRAALGALLALRGYGKKQPEKGTMMSGSGQTLQYQRFPFKIA